MFGKLNSVWHKQALFVFFLISIAHLAEHIVQMAQIHLLKMPLHDANGILGMWFPWLITSEVLHYAYAFIMLIGLFILWPGFSIFSSAWGWWGVAVVIQIWHHFEHCLLIGQAMVGHNLFGSAVPISILQLAFPRAELHFTYNLLVLIPMVIAMWKHRSEAIYCNCRKNVQMRDMKEYKK